MTTTTKQDLTTSVTSRMASYLQVCEDAARSEELLLKFKRHPHYMSVLEHVSEQQGREYLAEIVKSNVSIAPVDDSLGMPITYDYGSYFGCISPTTLRYMKVLCDLYGLFGSLNGLEIAEIGCGYGGQYVVAAKSFPDIKSYTMIDLPAPCRLITAYINKCAASTTHKLPAHTVIDTDHVEGKGKMYDLVISNYALSECSEEVIDNYFECILNRARQGYITVNGYLPGTGRTRFLTKLTSKSDRLVRILPEVPLTAPDNTIFTWKTVVP